MSLKNLTPVQISLNFIQYQSSDVFKFLSTPELRSLKISTPEFRYLQKNLMSLHFSQRWSPDVFKFMLMPDFRRVYFSTPMLRS